MALLKCPDCEKMVSPRVESCPFCGCPRKFFTQEDENKSVNSQEEAGIGVVESKEEESETVENIYFSFGTKQLFYDVRTADFAAMYGDYRKIADNALMEAAQRYDNQDSFKSALDAVRSYAKETINNIVTDGVKLLYKHHVIMTNSEFISRYKINYDNYTKDAERAYSSVMDEKQEMQAYREAEKASRSRWQGGGFGLTGAIKGAVQAGALNMGADFLHSFGDASKANQDNRIIQGKTNAVYQRYRWDICSGVYLCILAIYNGIVKELKKVNYFQKTIPLDEKKAETLFEATMQNASSDEEKINNILMCINLFPGSKKMTDKLLSLISIYRNVEFGEWLEFWHLEYRYPDYRENKKCAEEFEDFMQEKGIEQFEFGKMKVESYVQLRKWIYEYYEKYNVDAIPEASMLTKIINEYYEHTHNAMTWYGIMEWVPLECDIFQFMTYMNREREGLIYSYLSEFWLYGDPEEGIPSKPRNLLDSEERILIYYDTSFMENGRKGFMVTTQGIYDLKTRLKLLLTDIEDIQVYDNGSIEVSKEKEIVRIKDEDLYDDNALNHIAKLLRVICVRYAGNGKLWCEKMSTPRPANKVNDISEKKELQTVPQEITCPTCGKIITYGNKFCNFCGGKIGDDKEEYPSVDMILCKACGKNISLSAKFCNFCGEPINQEDGKYEM